MSIQYREFLEKYPQFRNHRLQAPGIIKLVELRLSHPDMSKSELARQTGISRPSVVKYLRILESSRTVPRREPS